MAVFSKSWQATFLDIHCFRDHREDGMNENMFWNGYNENIINKKSLNSSRFAIKKKKAVV